MGKRGRNQKKDNRNIKRRPHKRDVELEHMDDEIDAFHKQRDIVPLDINNDIAESDEDDEQPVFDFEEEEKDDDEDEDNTDDDDTQDTGFIAKLARQQKFLRAKFGSVDDEVHDDHEDEEDKRVTWGGMKRRYYDGDNVDFELQSSDDESLAEEEAEAIRLQRKVAESLTMEDVGLQDDSEDEGDRELSLEEISVKGKRITKSLANKEAKGKDDMVTTVQEVEKDLNSLSREEQMDVVYSAAPELVGLLSELNDAVEQLENQINPLLSKVKEREIVLEGGTRFLEMKQQLLLAYCQFITFYLLLKSEGQPVRDHPVIARLIEVKGLLDKMKELEGNLPLELEEFLKRNNGVKTVGELVSENAELVSDSVTRDPVHSLVSAGTEQGEVVRNTKEAVEQPRDASAKLEPPKDYENKGRKCKHQDDQVGPQSMEMLKLRAALEEKLKQKGIFSSIAPKPDKGQKRLKSVNGKLETFDDFDDDAINVEGGASRLANARATSLGPRKLSQLVTAKQNKPKAVSGDDDLPKRDDIGERRRKHELRVLAGAGVRSEDDGGDEHGNVGSDEMMDGDTGDSEDEFYKQVKQQRDAKLAAKAEIYTRTSTLPSLPQTSDGKRRITSEMEKNRGLTRKRKKEAKNPRKKYRSKHADAVVRRKGQVRDIRKPCGPYGGESTGINAAISRSIRFNY